MNDDTDTNTVTTIVVPVLREELRVDTRLVDRGGAAIHILVHEREEEVERLLRHDDISVERVAVGRVIDRMPQIREEEGVTIIPVVEEELVVSTRLILREEIRVRRTQSSTPWKETVRLRQEHAIVEPIATTTATSVAQHEQE